MISRAFLAWTFFKFSGPLCKVCQALVQAGAYVDARDINENTPLHLAAKSLEDKSEICKVLIEAGANVNARNGSQSSPLHLAVNVKVCQELVQAGANVNAKTIYEETPLHLAVMDRNLSIMKYLLENGAQIDPKDTDGKTPFDWAIQAGTVGQKI